MFGTHLLKSVFFLSNAMCFRNVSTPTERVHAPSEQSARLRTFLRFLCLARLSRLPLPCNRGFDVWEEPGVEGGVASGESGSFFNCVTKQKEIKKTSKSNFQVNSTNTPLQLWVSHLWVRVVVDVAGRDHVTDWVGLHGHFLLHQQRQIHNLGTESHFRI